jgi:hypothetical protein
VGRQRAAIAYGGEARRAGSSPAASAFRSGVVESVRRATVTREAQVRSLSPEPFGGRCPWRHGSLITSKAWFDSRTSDSCSIAMAADAGFAGVGRSGRRQRCNRSKSSWLGTRRAGLRSASPPWSNGYDAGPSTRKLRVQFPPGVSTATGRRGDWPPRRLREPEIAGSTPAGQTDCRSATQSPPMPALPASAADAVDRSRSKSSWLAPASRTSNGLAR